MAIDPSATWHISDHACRACGGRVLLSTDGDRARCADCGLEAIGDHAQICWCGSLPAGSRIALKCVRNEHRSTEFPSEVIAIEAPPAAAAGAARRSAGAA